MLRFAASLLVALALCGGPAPAQAGSGSDERPPIRLAQNGPISVAEAVRIVKRAYGDVTVLRVETRNKSHGRVEYRVRILTGDGHVREVKVDGNSGEID
jgi:uncharacterized membrane protein YkoI